MSTERTYRRVADALCSDIDEGVFPVGGRLPPERTLAERFDVSRTTIREALIALEVGGVVAIKQGSGISILQRPSGVSQDVGPGPFELLEARVALEGEAAYLAATRISEAELERLASTCGDAEHDVEDGTSLASSDRAFHEIVARACRNSVIENAILQLRVAREHSPLWTRVHEIIADFQGADHWNYDREALIDHRRILGALRRRDAEEARQAMRLHVTNVKNALLEASEADETIAERWGVR